MYQWIYVPCDIFYIRIQKSRAQIRFTGIANCETESVCSNNDNKFYCNCAIPFWCRKKLSKCEKVHCSLIWIAKICYYCLTLLALFDTHFSWVFFYLFSYSLSHSSSFLSCTNVPHFIPTNPIRAPIIIINTHIWRVISQ